MPGTAVAGQCRREMPPDAVAVARLGEAGRDDGEAAQLRGSGSLPPLHPANTPEMRSPAREVAPGDRGDGSMRPSASTSCFEGGASGLRARWLRAADKVKQLGKGAADVPTAACVFLLPDHWLEVFDPHHRFHLKPYFAKWQSARTSQGFYEWLDSGGGRDLDLRDRPRAALEADRIHYCTPEERAALEVEVGEGGVLRYRASGRLVHTGLTLSEEEAPLGCSPRKAGAGGAREAEEAEEDDATEDDDDVVGTEDDDDVEEEEEEEARQEVSASPRRLSTGQPDPGGVTWMLRYGEQVRALGSSSDIRDTVVEDAHKMKNRWIYVLDIRGRMYVNKKVPGAFHHSSFMGGEPVRAAGSISVSQGTVKVITAWSGHYRPTQDSFLYVIRYLRERGVDMHQVKQYYSKSEVPGMEHRKSAKQKPAARSTVS